MVTCPDEEYKGQDRRTRCDHADEAAEKAVRKTFAILGVDIDSPKEVKDFQESLRFGDKLKQLADKSLFGMLTALVTLAVGSLWFAVTRQ